MRPAWLLAGLAVAAAAALAAGGSLPAHMAAHGVVASVAAPLIVLGTAHTRSIRVLFRSRALRPLLRPPVAWMLFVAVQWAFHLVPAVLEEPLLHAPYLAVALIFWLPVLGRHRAPRPLRGAARAGYLFLAVPATDLAGLWLMATGRPEAGIAMIAGMLPLGAAAVAAAWVWVKREEERAVRWEAFSDARG